MPLRTEIFHSLYGAFRLLLLDQGGMRWFNVSITGFYRSFLAAILVAPIYFLTLGSGGSGGSGGFESPGGPDVAAPTGLLTVQILQYLAGWVTFPLVMILITRLLELSDRYIAYIIAYNWASVIMIGIMVPASLLTEAMQTPQPGLSLTATAYYVTLVFVLFYNWFVAQTALHAGAMAAVAIVLLDLIIGFSISIGGNRFFSDAADGAF